MDIIGIVILLLWVALTIYLDYRCDYLENKLKQSVKNDSPRDPKTGRFKPKRKKRK